MTVSTSASAAGATALALDAEALYGKLLSGVRAMREAQTQLVGITSGGAWLVERLQKDLGLDGAPGDLTGVIGAAPVF